MSGDTVSVRTLCERIHSEVSKYPYQTDAEGYGTPDYWDRISQAKRGDCEDYVLEMKWQLVAAGVPQEKLRIGICTTELGQDHAVLVVTDDANDCDWILDQRQARIMSPNTAVQIGYKGIMIERPGYFLWRRWKI